MKKLRVNKFSLPQSGPNMDWGSPSQRRWTLTHLMSESESQRYVAHWFLRAIGLVLLIYFLRLIFSDLQSWLSPSGPLSLYETLEQIKSSGFQRPKLWFPSWFWFSTQPLAVTILLWLGLLFSAMIAIGQTRKILIVLVWSILFSFTVLSPTLFLHLEGRVLLEVLFISIFLFRSALFRFPMVGPRTSITFLLRFFLLKLVLMVGWPFFQAAPFAYINASVLQGLWVSHPNASGMALSLTQFPLWLQRGLLISIVLLCLSIAVFLFSPRRLKKLGFFLTLALLLICAALGHFGFAHLVLGALSLLLLQDDDLLYFLKKNQLISWKLSPKRLLSHDLISICLLIWVLPAQIYSTAIGLRRGPIFYSRLGEGIKNPIQPLEDIEQDQWGRLYFSLNEHFLITSHAFEPKPLVGGYYAFKVEDSKSGMDWTLRETSSGSHKGLKKRLLFREAQGYLATGEPSFLLDLLKSESRALSGGSPTLLRITLQVCRIEPGPKATVQCKDTDKVILEPPLGGPSI